MVGIIPVASALPSACCYRYRKPCICCVPHVRSGSSRVKLRWPKWWTPDVTSPSSPLGRFPFQLEPFHPVKFLPHPCSSQLSTANPNQCFYAQSSRVFRPAQPAAVWAAARQEGELCGGNNCRGPLRWYCSGSAATACSIS